MTHANILFLSTCSLTNDHNKFSVVSLQVFLRLLVQYGTASTVVTA